MADTAVAVAEPGLETRRSARSRCRPLARRHRRELKPGIAEPRAELQSEIAALRDEPRLDIAQRPTCRQSAFDVFAIVGLVPVVLTIAAHFAR